MRTIVMVLLATGSAVASPADELGDKAENCWNMPAFTETNPDILFDVEIGPEGTVKDISVVEFTPTGAKGEEAVRSASLAIERCSPYKDVPAGTTRFRLFVEPPAPPIDPFEKAN